MKPPQEYVDFLNEFQEANLKAVRIDDVSRDDYLCLKMAAFCLDMPIDVTTVKNQPKGVFLIRKVEV